MITGHHEWQSTARRCSSHRPAQLPTCATIMATNQYGSMSHHLGPLVEDVQDRGRHAVEDERADDEAHDASDHGAAQPLTGGRRRMAAPCASPSSPEPPAGWARRPRAGSPRSPSSRSSSSPAAPSGSRRSRPRCPPRPPALPLDLLDDDAPAHARAYLEEHHGGRLDLLVNNAGAGGRGTFAETGAALARRTMALNFDAQLRLTEALLPLLRAAAPSAIVNIASTAGRVGRPGAGAYSRLQGRVRRLERLAPGRGARQRRPRRHRAPRLHPDRGLPAARAGREAADAPDARHARAGRGGDRRGRARPQGRGLRPEALPRRSRRCGRSHRRSCAACCARSAPTCWPRRRARTETPGRPPAHAAPELNVLRPRGWRP